MAGDRDTHEIAFTNLERAVVDRHEHDERIDPTDQLGPCLIELHLLNDQFPVSPERGNVARVALLCVGVGVVSVERRIREEPLERLEPVVKRVDPFGKIDIVVLIASNIADARLELGDAALHRALFLRYLPLGTLERSHPLVQLVERQD